MTYNLDGYISDRLGFYYVTKVGSNGNTKVVVLERIDSMKNKKLEHMMTKLAQEIYFL